MLGRPNRFHGHNSVRVVYRHGQAARTGFASLHYRRNDKLRGFRAAVVVSKKVDKSAVNRNRIRRRTYEIIRSHDIAQPYELVLTVHSDQAAQLPFEELKRHIDGLLLQARVIGKE